MSDDKILKCSKKSKLANTFVPMIDVNFILIKLMLFLILKMVLSVSRFVIKHRTHFLRVLV